MQWHYICSHVKLPKHWQLFQLPLFGSMKMQYALAQPLRVEHGCQSSRWEGERVKNGCIGLVRLPQNTCSFTIQRGTQDKRNESLVTGVGCDWWNVILFLFLDIFFSPPVAMLLETVSYFFYFLASVRNLQIDHYD